MALHLAASPAAFSAGHPAVQEHDIAVGLPALVLSTVANLLSTATVEHDAVVIPPAHPLSKGQHHAKSALRAAPHKPVPYRPPLLTPRPSSFGEGAQPPTAWSMASSHSQMYRPRPPYPQHSVAPGQHLLAMSASSALQSTQHQSAWYKHMALDHSQ